VGTNIVNTNLIIIIAMYAHLPALLALFAPFALFALLTTASASPPLLLGKRQAFDASNPYVPTSTSCPTSLIRTANSSLNADEQAYIAQRLPKATQALSAWLTQALPGVPIENLPTLALALSGGGTKAGLTTARAIYGLDGRESSNSSVAGLLQSMTYISALSGGSLTCRP
jgi:lysophospholipase